MGLCAKKPFFFFSPTYTGHSAVTTLLLFFHVGSSIKKKKIQETQHPNPNQPRDRSIGATRPRGVRRAPAPRRAVRRAGGQRQFGDGSGTG